MPKSTEENTMPQWLFDVALVVWVAALLIENAVPGTVFPERQAGDGLD